MSEPQLRGAWGESLARQYLEEKGFDFIQQNYLCKMGEIMMDGTVLVFIEVRVRNTKLHGDPLESINHRKQQKVRRTAERYIQGTNYKGDARIDVVGIDTSIAPPVITWISNAF